MQQVGQQGKTYTVSAAASLLGSSRRVLADAVVPTSLGESASSVRSYGWISGACASPSKNDRYLVEFIGKREFRIVAYVDRFARVFTTDEPLVSPPARMPDVDFAYFPEQEPRRDQQGFVRVQAAGGDMREVARYTCVQGRYAFFDSWFDFGPHGADLSYDDALARAYFAFVLRPAQGAGEVPTRGIDFVHECLRSEHLLEGLRCICATVQRVEADPVVHPPSLARLLARWLDEAGLGSLSAPAVPDDALRLVRTARYANTFYVVHENAEAPVELCSVWALEAALNRFLLIEEAFGEQASAATEADCIRWDAYLVESAGAQPLSWDLPAQVPAGAVDGEWAVRCGMAAAIERLKVPLRIEVALREDVEAGLVAFALTVPDASLMPQQRASDAPTGVGWVAATDAERDAQARRYAMRFALALAALAFEASPSVQRVDVAARPLRRAVELDGQGEGGNQTGGASGGEFPPSETSPAYFQVTLTRQAYDASGRFRAALESDPAALLASCGAMIDVPDADPFAPVEALPSAKLRHALPETKDMTLSPAACAALGVDRASGLRIVADGHRRHLGEVLAERVRGTATATEAIRAVREEQEAAAERGDDAAVAACLRLMAALAEGSLDMGDQNAVVSCFIGEDRCLAALNRARGLAQGNPQEAVGVLMDAVAEAAALDGFVDGATTVYRSFDSYASRVLYERARQAAKDGSGPSILALSAPALEACAAADSQKRVLLASDSFYLCHLEIVSLLERSFDRVDDALRYGRRAIELAPATAAGYRQLGRAYMLVGDMENAIAVLESCLRVATQQSDIAIAYYQLAYALWKAGRHQVGAACYLKSVMVAPVVALQAMAELKGLVDEQGIEPIDRDDVDGELEAAGIVVAPTSAVVDLLSAGAAAAVDAGLFPVAHNLLSLRLRYRPDDALVSVMRSLEGS
ncbi:MAG: tetratricopeptide repeat protein [Gordonibacter sp.]|uniref:tetratricopeptide repeat protein n=1 Tax=Gordonibacter sp. TaxID=1968902 RepID=UPI002FC96726